jgi:PAS domain S-box-containing protein
MADAPELDPQRAVELLTHANDPIFLLDETGTIVWANPAVRDFGWEPSELVGLGGLDQLDPADHERALAAMAVIADGHRLPSSAPYTVLTPSGEGIECDVSPIVLGGPADTSPLGLGLHLRPTHDSRVLRRGRQRAIR